MAAKKGLLEKAKDAIVGVFASDAMPTKRTRVPRTASPTTAKTSPSKKPAAKKSAVKRTAGKPIPTGRTSAKHAPAKKVAAKKTMDRKLIALSEPYEIRDWCKSLGCTEPELRAAVGAVGRSTAKVRAYLKIG
jgi:hypothetical protein